MAVVAAAGGHGLSQALRYIVIPPPDTYARVFNELVTAFVHSQSPLLNKLTAYGAKVYERVKAAYEVTAAEK
mgnify:CR=1 FL=1